MRKLLFAFVLISMSFAPGLSKAEDPIDLEWERAVDMLRFEMSRRNLPVDLLSDIDPEKFEYNHRAARAKLINILWPRGKFGTYTDARSLRNAKRFMKKNRDRLLQVEDETLVPPRYVAAILLVETRFAVYPPKYYVGDAVFSLAALIDDEFAKLVIERLREDDGDMEGFERVDWEERARKIGKRWLEELEAILVLSDVLDLDLDNTKGSWAGAIGYAQALPSTLLRNIRTAQGHYLVVDPWDWNDSMLIVARHLHENGWPEDENEEAIDKAILGYNYHSGYLREVKKVAERLKGFEASIRSSNARS